MRWASLPSAMRASWSGIAVSLRPAPMQGSLLPVQSGGGYAEDHASIVDRHVLTHTAARQALPRLARVAEERRRRLLNAL